MQDNQLGVTEAGRGEDGKVRVELVTTAGSPRTIRTCWVATWREAMAAVEAHASEAGMTGVRRVACEDGEYRYTATTPGGRHGRNVAYAVYMAAWELEGLEQ